MEPGVSGFPSAPDDQGAAATSAWHVTSQVKLKLLTVFLELCGKALPPGFDGVGAGFVPSSAVWAQLGQDELDEYIALLEKGAWEVSSKEVCGRRLWTPRSRCYAR